MRELDFIQDNIQVREDECQQMLDMAMRWCAYADNIGASRKAFRKACIRGLKEAFQFVFDEFEDAKITILYEEEGNDD